MKKRILSLFMCAVLVFSAVVIAPGAGAGGFDGVELYYVTAQSLYDFLGAENAELSGDTVKLINDFSLAEVCAKYVNDETFDSLLLINLNEDITLDLNGHTVREASLSIIRISSESQHVFTVKDTVGTGKMIGEWYCPLLVADTPLVIDGGTYIGRDTPDFAGFAVSALELQGDINAQILSGSFYGGQSGSGVTVMTQRIEKLFIGDGVIIQGGDQNAEEVPFRPGHGLEINRGFEEGVTVSGNPIEIGAAVIKGGNVFEGGNGINSEKCKVRIKISKSAVLAGGTPDGKPISVPEGSEIEWVDASAASGFSDVPSGRWYTEYVNYVAENKLMNGIGENMFAPLDTLTRAMFVQILANIAGVDTTDRSVTTKFSDVPSGKWYTPAVMWASENEIVNGMTESTFEPQGNIQRQQLCVMLARFAKVYGIELGCSVEKVVFSDDNLIQSYARDAVYACQQAGIISGMTSDTFAPRDNATRAQIAKIMTVFHRDFMTAK